MGNANDMSSKFCIVTGATSGIGKAIAFELVSRNAAVILICRNRQKGEDVIREIQKLTRRSPIDLLIADLSSQQQVRAVANEFNCKYGQLHVLINNAGAMFPRREESVDGIEMTLAVNHLAPFLLTNLLLDKLKATRDARIINVNSDAHEQGKIDFADIQMHRRYGRGVGMRAYANAKLANLLTIYELARCVQHTHVTVNALHPGYVATNIVLIQNVTGLWRLLRPFWSTAMCFILTPEKGALSPIFLACSPDLAGISGKYFEKCAPIASSPASYDRHMQTRMWDISQKLTEG
jgi:NAD(P)-dependent dehydrogenase (short-subunit alcohol dehydrogenase family)